MIEETRLDRLEKIFNKRLNKRIVSSEEKDVFKKDAFKKDVSKKDAFKKDCFELSIEVWPFNLAPEDMQAAALEHVDEPANLALIPLSVYQLIGEPDWLESVGFSPNNPTHSITFNGDIMIIGS